MVVTTTNSNSDEHLRSTFASRYATTSLPGFKIPSGSMPKEAAYQTVNDELMLDGNPGLNLASFNCMENARLLKEGIDKAGRFNILSKDIGVPLVAFSLKDCSRYTVFQISESFRRFGWIVPAYTMPPRAEHIGLLRVVIREDFNLCLTERLVSDFQKVVKELDELPPRAKVKAANVTLDDLHRSKADGLYLK
ncbi:Glutamate decarboxylase [Handroanthus impetiginosus]|uniref:glutamate decarboxylase n=1 Tax=Handroanthus impetiginosus TaxID=429701 RepID=A0A2G9GKV0_9LAMI|nr:Glutamate decarboxylase [Handroanthus impetiginosus]